MTLWHFYFFAKFYLHFSGHIHAGFYSNALLLFFLHAPLPQKWRDNKILSLSKSIILWTAAITIFWNETWFPPLKTIFKILTDPAEMPSWDYAWRFLLQNTNPWLILILAGVFALIAAVVRKGIRLTPVIIALMAVMVVLNPSALSLNKSKKMLNNFYSAESKRVVKFERGPEAGTDFDIIIIQICSFSWDDMRSLKVDPSDFFSNFDYLFTAFNSVSTYSSPTAIRLLRANCGQTSHKKLFDETPDECYLTEMLRKSGYKTFTMLNHPGTYSHFARQIAKYGKADPPMDNSGLPVTTLNFDGTPNVDDLSALKRWWDARLASGHRKAALYYDTVSLHMGNHPPPAADRSNPWIEDSKTRYKKFLAKFMDDMNKFFAVVRESNRNVAVVFVSEHGAAVKGNKMQASDLREIPLPQIVTVPAGIKLFGAKYNNRQFKPLIISKPVSYLALSYMLSQFIKQPPFAAGSELSESIINNIPKSTAFLAENESCRVMKNNLDFLYSSKDGPWIALPKDAVENPPPVLKF